MMNHKPPTKPSPVKKEATLLEPLLTQKGSNMLHPNPINEDNVQDHNNNPINNTQEENFQEPSFQKHFSIKKNFTQIPNHLIRDKSISMAARLLLIFLLSLPDEVMNDDGQIVPWVVKHSHLKSSMNIGSTALNNYIEELLKAGYMQRSRLRKKNGRYLPYNYLFADSQIFLPNRVSQPGSASVAKQHIIIQRDINTESNNTYQRKQQQGDAQKSESASKKSSSSAAVSSSSNTTKEMPSAKAKPISNPKKEVLKNVKIPDVDKEWIENTYNFEQIKAAVDYGTHPNTVLRKPLAAVLKWFCRFAPKDRPVPPGVHPKNVDENRKIAQALEKVMTHEAYQFVVLTKHALIEKSPYISPIIINYETPNFKEFLINLLKEEGFKRKT